MGENQGQPSGTVSLRCPEHLRHAAVPAAPRESCINPFLRVRLSLPPTPHHRGHPAPPRQIQGREVTRGHRLTGMGMRFIVLSCFFCCEKGKSITLRREGAGVALCTGEQRNGPQPKPSPNSFPPPRGRTSLARRSSRPPQQGKKTEKL